MVAVFLAGSMARAQAPVPSAWRAVDVAVGSDNKPRVLWTHPDGRMRLWTVGTSGVVEAVDADGPYAGWTARAVSVGGDGKARLMWSNADGRISLHVVNALGVREGSAADFGPFSDGPGLGWAAIDLATGADNQTRVLWSRSDGRVSLWVLNTALNSAQISPSFGPDGDWRAKSIGVGWDNKMHLLSRHPSGQAIAWLTGPTGTWEAQASYGPYSDGPGLNWAGLDLAVGADNKARVLWGRADGKGDSWILNGVAQESTAGSYGPFAGWNPLALSLNTDSRMSILWGAASAASVWTTSALGAYQSNWDYNFAPSNLTASGEDGRVRLAWSAGGLSTSADRFNVYRAASASGTYTLLATTSTSGTSYVDATATPGTPYFYRVTTSTGQVESASTASASATAYTSILVNDVSITEGNTGSSNLVFTLSLSKASSQSVSVNVFTLSGTASPPADYATTSGVVTFSPGVTSRPVVVPIAGDTLDEDDETFRLILNNVVNAALSRTEARATIIDDDAAPTVSVAPASVTEPDAGVAVPATFVVSLSSASGRVIYVDYATATGTASGSDFSGVNNQLVFSPGETVKNVPVLILGDDLDEDDETFTFNLSLPVNVALGTASATGTIVDNDPTPSLSLSDISVAEGQFGTTNATFTLNLSKASGRQVTVSYATADGTATQPSDYTRTTGTVTFSQGISQKTITVPVVGDTTPEANETFTLNLSNAVAANLQSTSATCTIIDDDTVTQPTPTPTATAAPTATPVATATAGPTPTATAGPTPTPGGALIAPTNLVATGKYKKIVLSWDAVPNAASYSIRRSTSASTDGMEVGTAAAPATTFTDDSTVLVIGTTYYYRVVAVNGSQTSGLSNQASAAPKSRFEIVSPATGLTVSGDIVIKAVVNDETVGFGDVYLLLDGVSITSAIQLPAEDGTPTLSFDLRTGNYANGSHLLQLSDGVTANSRSRSLIFDNEVSNTNYEQIFDVAQRTNYLPSSARIRATVKAGLDWSVLINDSSGNVVKSFNGTGTAVDVQWDGTNDTGAVVRDDFYLAFIRTQAAQAAAPTALSLRSTMVEKDAPSTLIRIELGRSTVWTASVLNAAGEELATFRGQGSRVDKIWDGKDSNGQPVPDGSYVVRVMAKGSAKRPPAQAPVQRFDDPQYWYTPPLYLNKGFAFDHLIMLDATDTSVFPGSAAPAGASPYGVTFQAGAVEYGKFIQHELRANPTSFSFPAGGFNPEVLLIDKSQLFPGCSMITHINNMLKQRLELVYVDAHGDSGFFGFGYFTWYASDPGTTGHGGGAPGDPNRGSREYNFDITKFTSNASYVNGFSPRLVWIDSCESAGAFNPGNPGGNSDPSFASAFGLMEAFPDGVFLGWNGTAGGYGLPAAPNDEWTRWRREFWDRLFAGKKNFITAFNQANSITPKAVGSGFNGEQLIHCEYRARWYGSTSASF